MASPSFKDKTIWNVNDASLVKTLSGHTDEVISLVVLPNGYLASGGGSNDGTIKIWNTDDGSLISTMFNANPVELVLLPNGLLASTSFTNVKIWNPDNKSLVKVLTGHKNWIWSMASLQNGLASADANGEVRIWN